LNSSVDDLGIAMHTKILLRLSFSLFLIEVCGFGTLVLLAQARRPGDDDSGQEQGSTDRDISEATGAIHFM
jgi:hypothetical protein